jgi:hypothetical protein
MTVYRKPSFLLLALAITAAGRASAQSSVDKLGRASDGAQGVFDGRIARPLVQDTTVYAPADVDSLPVYPGGTEALYRLISGKPACTISSAEDCLVSKAMVAFTVERDGRVSDFTVENEVCEALRSYALCSYAGMDNWTPALKNGRTVRCRMRTSMRVCFR